METVYDDALQRCLELIKLHGLEMTMQIIQTLKPYLPYFISNQELASIAIAIATLLVPMAVGTTITAADVVSKVAVFGVDTGLSAAKMITKAGIETASLAADLIIKKPIYLLCYPFKKYSQNKQLMEKLELARIKEGQRLSYKKNFQETTLQKGKLFLIIRQIKGHYSQKIEDKKILIGNLQQNDSVGRLLPIVKKSSPVSKSESIQFICNGNMLKLDSKLSTLPRNQFGAIEIYYSVLQTFG